MQAESGRSDPSNLDRDLGPNPLDMRHNFTGNVVYTSENHSTNAFVRGLLNGNEIGVLLQFNSGLPLNISATNRDLNGDGVTSDRPLASRATRCTCRRARTSTCATRASIPIRGVGARGRSSRS